MPKKKVPESSTDSDSGPDDRTPAKKAKGAQKSDEGGLSVDLGKLRRVTVSSFKGKVYVNIREYFQDKSGKELPGRKGISLTPEQWKLLMENSDAINDAIKEE